MAETMVIDVEARFRDNTDPGLQQAQNRVDRYEESLERTQQQLSRLNRTRDNPQVTLEDRATSRLERIFRSARSLAGRTYQFAVSVRDYATAPLRNIFNLATSLKGIVLTIGAKIAIDKTISRPIGLADAYTSALIGFETLFKSEKKAQKMMDDLDAFAKETPFKTSGVIKNAQKMMAVGWNPDDIIKDLNVLGDAAAASGQGDEGLNRIILAISQIRTNGRVYTEELINNGIYWLGSCGHSCEETHSKTA